MRRSLAGLFLALALLTPAVLRAEPSGFVESIGYGWLYRPNCFIPMLVNLTSDRSGTYQIRVYQEDMDRDQQIFTQTITLTGASPAVAGSAAPSGVSGQKFWVYFIPQPTDGGLPDVTRGGNLRDLQQQLKVFLCDANGKQITQLPITQTIQNLEATPAGTYGAPLGARLVLAVSDSNRQPVWRDFQRSIGKMEDVIFLTVHSTDLPEDPRGYEMVDGIVWLDAPAPDPAKASEAKRYHALRAWVAGGGHLVICQPPQRQANEDFDDLLPVTVNEIQPKKDLEPLKTLATQKLKEQLDREGSAPAGGTNQSTPFDDATGEDALRGPGVNDWDAPRGPFMFARATLKPGAIADCQIQWKPDGSDETPYIARIGYGAGEVTWVADDLADPAITNRAKSGWPFVWERVLDYKDDLTIVSNRTPENVRKTYTPAPGIDVGKSLISPMELVSRGRALVSIAVVFFIAYWLIAGPGIYIYLLSKSRSQLSWFLFAFSAVAATFLTILVVDLVVRGAPQLAHVTIVRSSPGEPALCLSRFGLYIPRDGNQALSLPAVAPKQVSYITAYPEHPQQAGSDVEFPAQKQYIIPLDDADSEQPVSIEAPYRSTLKKFQVKRWGAAGGLVEGAPSLIKDDAGVHLAGNLLNNTGHLLKNIYFVYHDPLINDDRIFYLPSWDKLATLKLSDVMSGRRDDVKFIGLPDDGANSGAPGQRLDKTDDPIRVRGTMGKPGIDNGWSRYWYDAGNLRGNSNGPSALDDLGQDVPRSFVMMSLFKRLPPMREFPRQGDRVELLRRGGRYLDVSNAISAGRLVVLAQTDQKSALPFPFQVDGSPVGGKGLVFYQFILPLDHTAGTSTPPTTAPTTQQTIAAQPPVPRNNQMNSRYGVFDPSTYTGPLSVPPLTYQQYNAVMQYRRARYLQQRRRSR